MVIEKGSLSPPPTPNALIVYQQYDEAMQFPHFFKYVQLIWVDCVTKNMTVLDVSNHGDRDLEGFLIVHQYIVCISLIWWADAISLRF